MSIFEKIIAREIPADIVFEDEQCIAFHDIAPQAPVHVLLLPKKPITSIDNFSPQDKELAGHLMLCASKIAQKLNLENGYRVVSNVGEDGGQSVPHLHFHILGGRSLQWPPG